MKQQRYFYMLPVKYEDVMYYPIQQNDECYFIPLDYKTYATQIIKDSPKWNTILQTHTESIYETEMTLYLSSKHKPYDKVEQNFGRYHPLMIPTPRTYEQCEEIAMEELLPFYTGSEEFVHQAIQEANTLGTVYPIDALLQLTNYETQKEIE